MFSASLLLACLPLSASALTLVNAGAYTSPRTAATGQTVHYIMELLSAEAVSNVTVSFQVRPYTPGGAISSTVVYTNTLTGQSFAANERKRYTSSFTVPSSLATGEYVWVTRATNATGSVVYLNLARTETNYTFHVDGVAARRYARGINIMDLGNAGKALPGILGTNYPKPTLAGMQRLKARGLDVVRIPFLWERIQPVLNGNLNTTYLGYLLETLEHANSAGLRVIVDMHNYARFTSGGVTRAFGSSGAPTKEQYADAWRRIVTAIRSNPAAYNSIYAYDIMNEPHDLPYLEGTFSYPVTFSSFESGTEGWVPRDSSSTTVSRVVRNNQGSLQITTRATSGSGLVLGAALPASTKRASLTNGPTFQAKVFVPTTTPGTIRARLLMVDGSYKYQFGEEFAVTKGVENRVYFKPPEATWNLNRSFSIEFIVDGSDGSAPLVFYLDNVAQGTQSGELPPQRVWETYSQAAVDAIRQLGEQKLIMVEGYAYSSAESWPKYHPVKWVNDSLNNIMYHAHFYFDRSGKYEISHAALLNQAKSGGYASVGDLGIARLKNFTDWVAAQNTQGFIGELGWPNSVRRPSESAAWNADGERLFQFLDQVGMGATMWTTGTWEQASRSNVNINTVYQIEPSFVPLSQAEVLERHLGKP
ncbi:cellulase family glycosylhydrolase [Archangium violaceum]|uniref:glycoside hydrolase family 5 protein n=1 Tax=Archangium violaceum TaxID=83451 RepID=UPI00193C501C|nr:cellulase family glycosylhydrolase [Archangium violaceum]QRK12435.1 cellulase family glycosylhydrolase [Archangium violaceum]